MSGLTEIRWHARAGQGAKTASQLLALALLRERQERAGVSGVRAGAARRARCARSRASSSEPIRRHDTVTDPDVVVVLEPSLVHEAAVAEGLSPGGLVLVNAEEVPDELAGSRISLRPGDAARRGPGSGFVNVVMLGAVAAALGEPPLEERRRMRPSRRSARRSRPKPCATPSRRDTHGRADAVGRSCLQPESSPRTTRHIRAPAAGARA